MNNPATCLHETLVPYEFEAGKKVYHGPKGQPYKNYAEDITLLGAHYIKVSRYFCPVCKAIIKAP